ncbi:hypothetical protein GUITHDRAFT_151895 [Guillardia theta CCMP2712]|uniref:Uncharacterized protein n=1 Tax=Guillardia theta (strain CCMP2712) TaxID=905079 RepID=L1IDK7_GUITC|nr:hypothetical protein GUITHDRAFT_155785 [Guillardia theta CCMP2712]XP_005834928.1 hypothetical protein GUITHDRAFT_151895 [Guillardia theta CCMP2712]EKX34298.1 hypothetical protein GUITHDRAFT_155785 [Guillardia theta CCMP2712]EKX47948.1 hypothetical protein GUITHDRAFT_151895 [Guillardia theta CCMP2712]|eukprot:XP_005821278.1 hypothetical protein GUITHDRAFT_155785 [Guillardia theta CCMP2712]
MTGWQVKFCSTFPDPFTYSFEPLYSPNNLKQIQLAGEPCEQTSARRAVKQKAAEHQQSVR